MASESVVESAKGCLLGLACGDALGRPVEFSSADRIEREHGRVTEMIAHGTHGKPKGTITDDTELALCVARSLADRGGFDGEDVARRFLEWYESDPFDIGLMTADAIRTYRAGAPWDRAGAKVWEERPEGKNAGNGSVMRCAPYALSYDGLESVRGFVSKRSSAITHADPRCTYGCLVLNGVLAALVHGESLALESVSREVHPEAPDELCDALFELRDLSPSDPSPSGYVIDTLQTALYDGLSADSAEDAIVNAVNRGNDTDTVGAIAGAIAGARFGAESLPDRWLEHIDEASELASLAETLIEQSHEDGTGYRGGRTVDDAAPTGPTYIRADPPIESGGHRPNQSPSQVLDQSPRTYSAADAVEADWIRRAYQRQTYVQREARPAGDRALPDGLRLVQSPEAVRVPEYCVAATAEGLPEPDRKRIRREIRRGGTAEDDAVEAFETVRDHVLNEEQVPETGQIAAVTRVGMSSIGVAADAAELISRPQRLLEALDAAQERVDCATECCALLGGLEPTTAIENGRVAAEGALGFAQSSRDAYYAAAIRHPEVDEADVQDVSE
ncbi:ADP-ribosylglycohydrolase family protein [Halomicrobium urmianum]|uniref:ADP-ribosylglycohydrolase family protein n=1 Tax=Halomicrobium urmianum TaxID=1586233 RepID=UPI0027E499E9|nr:ADP-ribosylglycohydrolase family protein [Halomicrobium urmianum]